MNKKHIYFDTTFLHYGDDLRGIPQVIMQLVRLFLSHEDFQGVRFIATKKVRSTYLVPLGVNPERIVMVGTIPFLPDNSLFHGLFCSLRYRKIRSSASLIIHGEFRTILKTKVQQAVLYHDLFLVHHFRDSVSTTRSIGKKFVKSFIYLYLQRKLVTSLSARYKVTNSAFTRKEILAGFPHLTPESITALPIGSRKVFSHHNAPVYRTPSATLNFLYVGGILDPRKNILAMLENLPAITRNKPFHLHLVGKISPESGKLILEEKLRSLQIFDQCTIHGLLPDSDLEKLYRQANFFLFPSLKEGFGLPVIEAMAHGLVVCAFNNTAISEIGSDALVLSENNDFVLWGNAVERLTDNQEEYMRLSEKAIAVADVYSEERMFERYRKYFLSILKTHQL